jgi:uncharacterized protein YecA (UPF0149 family)
MPEWIQLSDPWWFYQPGQIAERQLRWREQGAGMVYPGEFNDDDFQLDEFEEFTPTEFSDFDQHFFPGDYPDLSDAEPHVRDAPKVGRNDPCPCGSGKKYKKCCLH